MEVAILGLGKDDATLVRTTISLYLSSLGWRYTSQPARADVLIADPGQVTESELPEHFRRGISPLIAVGDKPSSVWLESIPRPLRYAAVLQTLRRTSTRDRSQVQPPLSPHKRLVGWLLRHRQGCWQLTHPRFATLYVDAERERWSYDGSEPPSDMFGRSIEEFGRNETSPDAGLSRGRPLDELRYRAGLLGSEGQPLDDAIVHRAHRLVIWPDFSSLPCRPSHLRLAAFISRRTASLDQLCETTGHPREEVIDFLNGCHAAGWTETRAAESTEAAVKEGRKAGRVSHSLLARLRARIAEVGEKGDARHG